MVDGEGTSTNENATRCSRVLKRFSYFLRTQLFCEDALKLHVFMYWLSCLIKLIRSADESFFATLSVVLSAFTLISALVAVAGRKPFYLIPFLVASVYEVFETIITMNLASSKFNEPVYYTKCSRNSICNFFLKNVGSIKQESLPTYTVSGILYATYFVIVVVTTLKLIKRYSDFQKRLSSYSPGSIVSQALADQLYYGGIISLPNDVENIVQNADSPPHYSV